jgi:hypothetical protein
VSAAAGAVVTNQAQRPAHGTLGKPEPYGTTESAMPGSLERVVMRLVEPQRLPCLVAVEALAHLHSEVRSRDGEPQKCSGSAKQTKLAV